MKYPVPPIYFEETENGEIRFDEFLDFFHTKSILINDIVYHINAQKNWLIRDDIYLQQVRLIKRGFSIDEALEYLKNENAPETIYDEVLEVIPKIKDATTWENKIVLMDELCSIITSYEDNAYTINNKAPGET